MNVKTIALTGAEQAVSIGGSHAEVKNNGTDTIYASANSGIVAGADGVVSIPAGAPVTVLDTRGTVYLLGTGSVEVVGKDFVSQVFNSVSAGGGTDVISNAAGIVTLDGLQGGVPFSDITLSGEIVGREVTLTACGKNLISYPYKETTKTLNGVTFTDNGNGTITVNGTATSATVFYLLSDITLPKGVYTLSGCPEGGSSTSYKIQFSTSDWSTVFSDYGKGATKYVDRPITLKQCRIAIETGTVMNSLVFCPQIEKGGTVTDYEAYHGSTIKITPDASPYTVPNDIRQQDGLNNVFASVGEISVTGVKKNAAIKRIWDEIDEIKTAIIVSNGEI